MLRINKRFAGVLLITLFSFFCSAPVFAAIPNDDDIITQKVYYTGIKNCFNSNWLKPSMLLSEFTDGTLAYLVNQNYPNPADPNSSNYYDMASSAVVNAANEPFIGRHYANTPQNSDRVSCKTLFTEKAAKKVQTNAIQDDNYRRSNLENANYTLSRNDAPIPNNDIGACYAFPIIREVRESDSSADLMARTLVYTSPVCVFGFNGNYMISLGSNTGGSTNRSLVLFEFPTGHVKMTIAGGHSLPEPWSSASWLSTNYNVDLRVDNIQERANVLKFIGNTLAAGFGGSFGNSHVYTSLTNVHCSDFNNMSTCTRDNDHAGHNYVITYYSACGSYESTSSDRDGDGLECRLPSAAQYDEAFSADHFTMSFGGSSTTEEYVKNPNASLAVSHFSNHAYNNADLQFSAVEVYRLYDYYLNNVYHISNITCVDERASNGVYGQYGPVKLWSAEEGRYKPYCYFDAPQRVGLMDINDVQVYGVDLDNNNNNSLFGVPVNFQGILTAINTVIDTESTPAPDEVTVNPDSNTPENPSEQFEGPDGCYAAGLENVAWIVCPMLNNMTTAVDNIDRTLHTMLAIDAEQFDARGATETAWKYFRNLANIAMILVLIVIIASQITGHGIDNYGIKKMLPKLIIMAILINLSFYICEIAVDISNILGEGLNNMFQSIGRSVDTLNYGNITVGALVTAVFGGASLVGAGSTAIITVAELAAAGGGVMLVVSFILVLLAALIAVLVFLLMLAGRMVVIILFTVISPLAFVCYILPNTQPLFKKWWKIFYTMLVMYPICGALYGLSFVIRSIVLSSSSIHWWQAALAIIAPYIPFFALPTLLKSAIGALGAIGGVLTGMGGFLRRGIQTGTQNIKQTGAYKADSERAARNQAMWRAGVKYDKDSGKFVEKKNANRGIRKLIRGGDIGMSHARAEVMRNMDTIAAEKAGGGVDLLNSKQAEAEEKQFLASADAYAKQLSQGGAVTFTNKDGNEEKMTNVSDQNSLGRYLNSLYRDWGAAKTQKDQREIMSKIVGVQSLLTGKKGAAAVDDAMRDALGGGYAGALGGARGAAYYYKQQNGQVLGATNKSTDELITNLAKGKTSAVDTNQKQNLHEALQKYDASTFAGAFHSEQEAYAGYAKNLAERLNKGGLDPGSEERITGDLYAMLRHVDEAEKSDTIQLSQETLKSFGDIKRSIYGEEKVKEKVLAHAEKVEKPDYAKEGESWSPGGANSKS